MRGIRASPADTHGLVAGLQYPDVRTSQPKQPTTTTTHPAPADRRLIVRNQAFPLLASAAVHMVGPRPDPRSYPTIPSYLRAPGPRHPRHMVLRDPTPGRRCAKRDGAMIRGVVELFVWGFQWRHGARDTA